MSQPKTNPDVDATGDDMSWDAPAPDGYAAEVDAHRAWADKAPSWRRVYFDNTPQYLIGRRHPRVISESQGRAA